MVEGFITDIRLTKRINECEWKSIKNNPLFLEFLRNRVIIVYSIGARDENGNPAMWSVLDWVETNTNDLWYMEDSNFYFYDNNDAIAFKLRWC